MRTKGVKMHQPTERVIQIIDAVARGGVPKTLSELSREIGVPKSTLSPILQTLCAHKYLYHNGEGRYEVGSAIFSLSSAFWGNFPVLDYVHSELENLVDKLNEACYFGVLEDGYVRYLDKVNSTHSLRVLVPTGRRLPAYATAMGKALMFGMSDEEIKSFYEGRGLNSLTDNTVTDVDKLISDVMEMKKSGYAWEIEESTKHIRCFGAPVTKGDKIVAAISVAIPVFRFDESMKEYVVGSLVSTAQNIGRMIEKSDSHFGDIF